MIFREIRLVNFRQYYGDINLKFSVPTNNDKNISILIADNGVGKSTLLQAFRYCFYGTMPNLLKLPKENELLSDYAIKNAKELDNISLAVEVKFEHNTINYIAVRKETFQKLKGKIIRNESDFTLSESTETSGYRKINNEEAIVKMWTMLPPEISQLFIFDGEHAEKKIEQLDSREFIRQSIIGLFNIKRIDTLIDILSDNNPNVISYIEKRYPDLSSEQKKKIEEADALKRLLKIKNNELFEVENQIKKLKSEKQELSRFQQTLTHLNEQVLSRAIKDNERTEKESLITNLSNELIESVQKALKLKLLNEVKNRYKEYVSVNNGDPRHYQLLHIDTLKDILEKRVCVCGRSVDEHSIEEEHIIKLFENALPQDYSHYFTLINEEFIGAEDYAELYKKSKDLKERIITEKYNLMNLNEGISLLNQEISSIEKNVGGVTQKDYNEIENRIEKLISERTQISTFISNKETEMKKLDIDTRNAIKGNVQREQFASIKEDLVKIVDILKKQKKEVDDKSRKILVKYFNENFNRISNSPYEANIDENYQLKIINTKADKDETDVLSTGQTVAITLTFLKSLIDTAKEILKDESYTLRHGVVIDAAMSNIDEFYTAQISKKYFKNLDQMILLSMRKSLRDELYQGIKENIGIAYRLTKDEENRISVKEIPLDSLYDYIHEKAG